MAISKAELLSTMTRYNVIESQKNEAKFVKKVEGKDLSSNDFTDAHKAKLENIEPAAQVNKIEKISLNNVVQTLDEANKEIKLNLAAYALKSDLEPYAKSSDFSTVYKYQGTVVYFSDLPNNAQIGYVWQVEKSGGYDSHGTAIKAGDNVAWNGTGWDALGGNVDLSSYLTSATAELTYLSQTDADNLYLKKNDANNEYLKKSDAENIYVEKVLGKTLSTNDFTNAYKEKVDELHISSDERITDEEIAEIFLNAQEAAEE